MTPSRSCLALVVRPGILHPVATGFVLRDGPFHRRFPHGCYPLHVTRDICHPGGRLRVVA